MDLKPVYLTVFARSWLERIEDNCPFSFKKKWRRKEKLSVSMWLQRQSNTCMHRSIKYVWYNVLVCSGAVVLYRQSHKPVNLGFIDRRARCNVQELKHTSLCHQSKRPHQGSPVMLSQFSHWIDTCSQTIGAMASLYDFLLLITMVLCITTFMFLKSSHIVCKKPLRCWPKTDAVSALFFYPLNVLMLYVF